jgi:hypothetical protein
MDPIDDLKKKQRQLSGWIADYKDRSDQVPYVQQSLDIVNYQLDIASKMPVSVPASVRNDIMSGYANAAPYWNSFMDAYAARSGSIHDLVLPIDAQRRCCAGVR